MDAVALDLSHGILFQRDGGTQRDGGLPGVPRSSGRVLDAGDLAGSHSLLPLGEDSAWEPGIGRGGVRALRVVSPPAGVRRPARDRCGDDPRAGLALAERLWTGRVTQLYPVAMP